MKRPTLTLLLIVCGLATAGCAGRPGDALSTHYNTSLPRGVKVCHFTGEAWKDPWFLWELAPVDDAFLKRLVANARLKPASKDMTRDDQFGLGKAAWWPHDSFGAMNEMYHLDEDSSFWRVWVDRKADRIWVLFFNM